LRRGEVPLGFGMALAENLSAMKAFSDMSEEKQKQIIEGTKRVKSKTEMQEYVNNLTHDYEVGQSAQG